MESADDSSSSSSSCPSWGALAAPWEFRSHALPQLPLVVSQFHEAAYSRRPDVLRIILSKFPSTEHRTQLVNSCDPRTSNTPFLWACMTGCLESISLLLEVGSNLSFSNSEGKNGLHLAVAAGVIDSVDYLLRIQTFLAHSGDSNGATPVHYASVAAPVIVGSFVRAGVSFLVQDHDGDTPLHWSCRESLVENVSLIYGTNQMLKEVSNSEGETPFQLALLYEEEEICQIFGGKSADVEDNQIVNLDVSNVGKEALPKTSQFSELNVWGLKPSMPSQIESRNLFGFGAQVASVN